MGNSIAVSKKPFVKYIVQPSVEFDPYDADDITNKVRQLLIEGARPSKLIIQNKIHEFIDFIYQ